MRFTLNSTVLVTKLRMSIGAASLTLVPDPDAPVKDLRGLRALAMQPLATGPQPLTIEAWGACFSHDRTGRPRIVTVSP